MGKVTENDFIQFTWVEYQEYVDQITDQIKALNVPFDYIVPIFRSGAFPATSISHKLSIQNILPVQYKYMNELENGQIHSFRALLYSGLSSIQDKSKPYSILVIEGSHCQGQTAQACINHIKQSLPNSRIYYFTIGRDFGHQGKLDNTEYEGWALLTNEEDTLTREACIEHGIVDKYIVFPWESIEEEMYEINATRGEL